MRKYIALLFALLLAIPLAGCTENAVLEETYIYEAQSAVHSLDIRIGAADFTIKHADAISVESNLKYLSISEENGVLTIIDEKTVGVTYDNPVLTLYVPAGMAFESVDISTGAAKLTASSLSVKTLNLQLGAGDASISGISVKTGANIKGGAGKITIANASINNLELKMGIGELNLTAALLENCNLSLGVGESNITLMGRKDDYDVDIEKGLGNITVDGKTVSDFDSSGSGRHRVKIEGGIGSINLTFQDSENE